MLEATMKTWPFGPPLDCGVEEGVVWATVKGPFCGVNGYVCIPADSHPWSKGFPRGEDSNKNCEVALKNMALFAELQKNKPHLSMCEAMVEATEQYEKMGYDLGDFLEVHGGVTYYVHPWVGFDTAHSGDIWSGEFDETDFSRFEREHRSSWSCEWTPELVVEEAKALARQVAEIGRLEKRLEIQQEEVK